MPTTLSIADAGGLLFAFALLIVLLVWLLQSQEERWSSRHGRIARLTTGWRWKDQPPMSFLLLKWVFWLYIAAAPVTLGTIAFRGPRVPDQTHSVPLFMRNGRVSYVQPWVSHAMELVLPVACILLLGLAILGWRNRRHLERYNRGAG